MDPFAARDLTALTVTNVALGSAVVGIWLWVVGAGLRELWLHKRHPDRYGRPRLILLPEGRERLRQERSGFHGPSQKAL